MENRKRKGDASRKAEGGNWGVFPVKILRKMGKDLLLMRVDQ